MRSRFGILSIVRERPNNEVERFRTRVVLATALVLAFACAFLVVAVAVSVAAATNHGTIGSAARNTTGGRASPASGVWGLALLLTAGAIWLVRSAIRALRHESYLGVVVPLVIFLVVGAIGEIIDLFGTASGASDLVGAGILVLAAIPVALMWRPLREVRATTATSAGADVG